MQLRVLMSFVFLLVLLTSAHSQKWFKSESNWKATNIWWKPTLDGIAGYGYNEFKVEADTILNGLQSKIVSVRRYKYDGTEVFYDRTYLLVREKDNQVFKYDNNTFQLIFDFNLNAGDTLPYKNINGCDSITLIIDRIEILNIGGESLKKQFITSVGYVSDLPEPDTVKYEIVEKIGVLRYLNNDPIDFVNTHYCRTPAPFPEGIFVDLRCYNDQDISYNNLNTPCDTLIILVSTEKLNIESKLLVLPNPSNGIFKLETTSAFVQLQVKDINGRCLIEFLNKREQIIDLSNYPSGMYFVNIVLDNGEQLTKKIIKL